MAIPFYALTWNDAELYWEQSEQVAFDRLKQLLIDAPVVAFPQKLILKTDASGIDLGSILAKNGKMARYGLCLW